MISFKYIMRKKKKRKCIVMLGTSSSGNTSYNSIHNFIRDKKINLNSGSLSFSFKHS